MNNPIIYYGYLRDFKAENLYRDLNVGERKRADQFLLSDDRNLFIVSRFFLKKILSEYLKVDINEIQINYGTFGKPYIDNMKDIRFNIAHSKELFVIALIKSLNIGVDIENKERNFSWDKLSEILFTRNELKIFNDSDKNTKGEVFINCWTRKEAVLKAKGTGLSIPFKEFEVSFLKEEKLEILTAKWPDFEKREWSLFSFDIRDDYRGALAVQGDVDAYTLIRVLEL